MQNELDVLRDISRRFDGAGLAYMLTGSMALNYYTQPRMTRDIDMVIVASLDTIDAFIRMVSPDYYILRQTVADAISRGSIFNIIHLETVVKVDCIVRKSTDYRKTEFARRQRIRIDDFQIWIVSKEDLIISKLDWAKDSHSDFQLRDVRNLLATGYDAAYLESWTEQLGLSSLLKECLHE